MNFTHTEDRRMLADSLNRFVAEQYGIEHRNQLAYGAEGHSPELYAQFAELGTIGALFPEAVGGFGGSGFDISVVFEVLGRGLVAEPAGCPDRGPGTDCCGHRSAKADAGRHHCRQRGGCSGA